MQLGYRVLPLHRDQEPDPRTFAPPLLPTPFSSTQATDAHIPFILLACLISQEELGAAFGDFNIIAPPSAARVAAADAKRRDGEPSPVDEEKNMGVGDQHLENHHVVNRV